jgi:PncC family amidohydrolase
MLKRVVNKLLESGKKLICAESCTGGLLTKEITDIPGASLAFYGGLVVYSNLLKTRLLDVGEQTLDQYGAVSFETAQAMVEGLRKIISADLFLSITGIAGPGGGSQQKPVGTVYIGFGDRNETVVLHFQFKGSRKSIRTQTAKRSLELIEKFLENKNFIFADLKNLIEIQIVPKIDRGNA